MSAKTTLQANAKLNKYTITFNANGGSGSMSPQQVTSGVATTLTTNTFTRSGYAFVGWNTQDDGSGTSYTDGGSITISSNTTLYAQWQQVWAENLQYSNTNTGVNCSDAQCMIDKIKELLD